MIGHRVQWLLIGSSILVTTVAQPGIVTAEESDGWSVDVQAALQLAQAEQKDLLMNFTGSDWCTWCIKLKDEVFSTKQFLDAVRDHFVLVEFDFPQDNSHLSAAVIHQNETWKSKLDVEGYPSVYLTDPTGRPYANTGYQEGGPQAYVLHLEQLRDIRVKRDESLAKAEQQEGIERAKLLDRALSEMDQDLVKTHYADLVKEIVKLDSDNVAGLRAKYHAQQDAEERREVLAKIELASRTLSPTLAVRVIDRALSNHQFSLATKVELLQYRWKMLEAAGQHEQAQALLQELIDLPEIEHQTRDVLRVQMVYALVKSGQTAEALARLDGFMEQDKKQRHRLLLAKGELLDRLGRHEEAIKTYEYAINATMSHSQLRHEIQMAISDSLASLNRIDESVALLDKLVSDGQMPHEFITNALLQKAMILREAGQLDQAQMAEQQVLDSAGTDAEKNEIRSLIQQLRQLDM